jgi:hypothetical protein
MRDSVCIMRPFGHYYCLERQLKLELTLFLTICDLHGWKEFSVLGTLAVLELRHVKSQPSSLSNLLILTVHYNWHHRSHRPCAGGPGIVTNSAVAHDLTCNLELNTE